MCRNHQGWDVEYVGRSTNQEVDRQSERVFSPPLSDTHADMLHITSVFLATGTTRLLQERQCNGRKTNSLKALKRLRAVDQFLRPQEGLHVMRIINCRPERAFKARRVQIKIDHHFILWLPGAMRAANDLLP